MRVAETSGKTVDEAVARALGQLGLRREQVDVDVIREGSKGFLGIGAEEAIVRVTAKETLLSAASGPRRPQQRPPQRPQEQQPSQGSTDGGCAVSASPPEQFSPQSSPEVALFTRKTGGSASVSPVRS